MEGAANEYVCFPCKTVFKSCYFTMCYCHHIFVVKSSVVRSLREVTVALCLQDTWNILEQLLVS